MGRKLSRVVRQLRGVVGAGLLWAVGWAIVGAHVTLVVRLVRPADIGAGEHEWVVATLFGLVGFLSGVGFGLVMSE